MVSYYICQKKERPFLIKAVLEKFNKQRIVLHRADKIDQHLHDCTGADKGKNPIKNRISISNPTQYVSHLRK